MSLLSQYRRRALNEATDLTEKDFMAPTDDKPAAPGDDTSPGDGDAPDDPGKDDNPKPEDSGDDLGEDDFTMDEGDDDSEDDDPEDTGDNEDDPGTEESSTEDEDGPNSKVDETILNISDVDRALAEKAMFSKYLELQGLLATIRDRLNDDLKVEKDEEERERINEEIDSLDRTLLDYIRYKFSIYSLEKNSINYPLFAKRISDILDYFGQESDTNANK